MENKQLLPGTLPLEITFGLELEFSILSVPDQSLDPSPNDSRKSQGITRPEGYPNVFLPYLPRPNIIAGWPEEWDLQFDALKRDIAERLTGNGYPSVADCDYDEASDDPSIKDLNRWVISMDTTVNYGPDPEIRNYYLWPVEIQSLALIYNEENKQKANRNYSPPSLHDQEGFFETKLVSTHGYLADMSRMIRDNFIGDDKGQLEEHDRNYAIDAIMSLKTVDEAVRMLSARKLDEHRRMNRLTYSICNLETDAENVKKTIEFRQHASTLDDEELYHWITVCRSLVHFASTVDDEVLIASCNEHINKTVDEFSIVEVLMAIRRPMQAYYYGARVTAGRRKRKKA
ncbi:hypothetical protein DSL72_001991 [Monilinia vaccinii-corymbosi]|uniref:Uncharacterized protein n=1 Tax=Monilinia vaccinii-corymbosi TaxID=61207 RepID=A0A8A3PBF0_9HELO|nr:hypothetical protein DSL72_001991 [Monilinia vaccinii-corymbosi]